MSLVQRFNESERAGLGKDAVEINKHEAVRMQWELIHNWKPKKDVIFLTYGPGILTAVGSFTGLVCSNFYRSKMNLLLFGHFSTYLPTIVFPGLLAPVFHKLFVSTPMVMDPGCVVCLQVRAAFLQCCVGFLQPLVVSPLSCYMLANLRGTVRLPSIYKDWQGLLRYHMKISKNFYKQNLTWMLIINMLSPLALTYLEMRDLFKFTEKIRQIEEYYENTEEANKENKIDAN